MRLLPLVVLLLVTACGKTTRQAITELQPAWVEVRAKLQRLAPVANGEVTASQKLDGSVYDGSNDANLSILMNEQLLDPDFEVRSHDAAYIKTFDPLAGGIFGFCLGWTGPKNQMSDSAMGAHDGEEFLKKCDPKKLRTLVVVKTVASVVPQLVSEGKFEGGRALLQVTAIDWATGQPLARFLIEGVPDQVVEYRVRPGESKAVEAAVSVHNSMWSDARKKLFAGLRERGAVIKNE